MTIQQELPHYVEFNGTVVIKTPMPEVCPLCGGELDGEMEQTDSGISFLEVFCGCTHCNIWWFSHSEVIQ